MINNLIFKSLKSNLHSQSLPHSSAQKALLVQVFLASILCLFHFVNYKKETNNKKIGTLSLTFLRPTQPTLCQRSCGFVFCQRSNSTLLFLLDFIIVFLV